MNESDKELIDRCLKSNINLNIRYYIINIIIINKLKFNKELHQ